MQRQILSMPQVKSVVLICTRGMRWAGEEAPFFRLARDGEGIQHAVKSQRASLRDTRMNCIHCQTDLPANYFGSHCPNCGKGLLRENPLPRRRWLLFFVVLLVPSVSSFGALALNLGFLAGLFGIFGSLISGLFCTFILIRILPVSGWRRALLAWVIGVLLCGLSFFLSGLGCSIASSMTSHRL